MKNLILFLIMLGLALILPRCVHEFKPTNVCEGLIYQRNSLLQSGYRDNYVTVINIQKTDSLIKMYCDCKDFPFQPK